MSVVVGVDEVGRGCWAGPLVAGAVILAKPIAGLKDSKKLTKKQREILADVIRKQAASIGLGWVYPDEIDSIGLTQAVTNAMHMALEQITEAYREVIIDGNFNFLQHSKDGPWKIAPGWTRCKVRTMVGADDLVPAVSAASIVAKVARDKYMAEMALEFPEYGFERHVGYGTAQHVAALELHGTTVLHRLSYKPIKALEA